MSQSTQFSTASTIPYEILEYQDELFIEEFNYVGNLYFGETSHEEVEAVLQLPTGSVNYESDNSEPSDDDHVQETLIGLETRPVDDIENRTQLQFLGNGCKCEVLYKGKPCSGIVDFKSLVSFRETCLELERHELDMTIMATLFGHRISKGGTVDERKRSHQMYFFQGHQVCRYTFCFAFGIGKSRLQAIGKSIDENGFRPRVQGLCSSTPKNNLSTHERRLIKMFISRYANDNALPLPGRLPNCPTKTVLLLPSDKKIADIHDLYEKSAHEMGCRHVSLRTFRRIWTELCPHISIAKPTPDLCQKCQKYAHSLTTSGQFCEEEKATLLSDYQGHIEYAKLQRDQYRGQTLKSKELNLQMTSQYQDNQSCSFDGTYHYSWDYAQQVHYPHHSQQVGPIFFKTPRKCHVFGVCAEGSGKQTFYLVDEGESVGKGAESVASMVHHYFKNFGIGEKHAEVHFDNCCGQNKNNVILWYAMWRVLTGLHETIQYSMMVAGHTKFAPDWHFGVWKVKWRDSNAETMEDIANSVRLSSRSDHIIPQLIKDQERPVLFYKWRSFLSRYFKKLKHITNYHHFIVSAKYPGYVICKEYSTSEEIKISLLKQKPAEGLLPELADIPGLDPSRQWYLYEQIREYFISKQARVCPQPIIPKVECNLDSHDQGTSANSRKRQTALLN